MIIEPMLSLKWKASNYTDVRYTERVILFIREYGYFRWARGE